MLFSPLGMLQKAIIFQLPSGAFQCKEFFIAYLVRMTVDDGFKRIVVVLSSSFLGVALAATTASNREGMPVIFLTTGNATEIFSPPFTSCEADNKFMKPSSIERCGPPGGQPLPSVMSIVRPRL